MSPVLSGSGCRAVGALALLAVVASCATSPGNAETDRVIRTVATAISWPHQDTADGYVRAALATHAGTDSRLTVVEVSELHANQLVDPLARIVFQVHLEASGTGFSVRKPITACYETTFSFYGIIGSPHRTGCPAGATAVVPPPLPPAAHAVIPPDFETTLSQLLASLPATPTAEQITATVTTGLPPPGLDPDTGLRDLPPTIDATVRGADLGVSLWAPANRSCLFGARTGGHVTVGRPTRVQMQPGELPCDPETALSALGTTNTP